MTASSMTTEREDEAGLESLADEFARLVKEYRDIRGPDSEREEAWNLIADFAETYADVITAGLRAQSPAPTGAGEAEKRDPVNWDFTADDAAKWLLEYAHDLRERDGYPKVAEAMERAVAALRRALPPQPTGDAEGLVTEIEKIIYDEMAQYHVLGGRISHVQTEKAARAVADRLNSRLAEQTKAANHWFKEANEEHNKAIKLEDRVAELEEALKPFVRYAKSYENAPEMNKSDHAFIGEPLFGSSSRTEITVGDLRRAHAALSPVAGEEKR